MEPEWIIIPSDYIYITRIKHTKCNDHVWSIRDPGYYMHCMSCGVKAPNHLIIQVQLLNDH